MAKAAKVAAETPEKFEPPKTHVLDAEQRELEKQIRLSNLNEEIASATAFLTGHGYTVTKAESE